MKLRFDNFKFEIEIVKFFRDNPNFEPISICMSDTALTSRSYIVFYEEVN